MALYVFKIVFFIISLISKDFSNAKFNASFSSLFEISYFYRFRKIDKLCWRISEEEIFFNIWEMKNKNNYH